MKNNFLPTISIVIATYNSQRTLNKCFNSIKIQNYPKNKIELIVSDGGSTDNTLNLARKFAAKIVHQKNIKQGPEINRAFGVHHARNQILLILDYDNILPDKNWLRGMVVPLIEDKSIVGVETLRYAYNPSFPILDRYFALYGVNDPLPFYLGKADRLSYLYETYNLAGKFKDCGKYYKVTFKPGHIPTLGSNGFLVRRKILLNHAKVFPLDNFFHIDVNVDLIRNGFNKYAFVKNSIIHLSGHKDFIGYLKRRKLFMSKYHLIDLSKRRYSVFERKDFWRLIYFIIISLTLLKPTYDAVRGYLKIRDMVWFLHPLMCFGTVIIYGYTFFEWQINKIFKPNEK